MEYILVQLVVLAIGFALDRILLKITNLQFFKYETF
jgi:hypothetical protein